MKIIRSTFFRKIVSEFGDFDFKPKPGFELRTYIDFESKLIIVEESPIQKISGVAYRPTLYVVHPQKRKIIDFNNYGSYFDYSEKQILSEDGKLRLIYQRKHDAETQSDYQESQLIDVASGNILSSGKRIVFSQTPIKNALEVYLEDLERRKKAKEKIAKQLTLEEHYEFCKGNLKEGGLILGYYDQKEAFKLIFNEGSYKLSVAKRLNNIELNDLSFYGLRSYKALSDFWAQFIEGGQWYMKFSPFFNKRERREYRLITKFIVGEANHIRKAKSFTKKEYAKLNGWENQVYSERLKREEYKQYCSNCGKSRSFTARYPKCLCRNCSNLITDKHGLKLVFYNTEALGSGCQGYYKGEEPMKKYTSSNCYIDGVEYYAEEAKFGGIVIQRKELQED